MMTMMGMAALVLAAMFAGAAFYINFAEHPARADLPVRHAVQQWAPSYKRGFTMQATLAVVSGLAAVAQWFMVGGTLWLLGAAVILANWPWTLLVIMPVNRQLLASPAEAEIPGLLGRWNALHTVRTVLGLLATLCFSAALLLQTF